MAILILLLLWSLVASRMTTSPITGPMVMVGAGLAISSALSIDTDSAYANAHFLAELTLIVVLCSDASKINLQSLTRGNRLPLQMLLCGLPGAIVLGTGLGL